MIDSFQSRSLASEQKFERQLEQLNSKIDGLMLTKEEKKEAIAAEQKTQINGLRKAQKKADEEAHLRIAKQQTAIEQIDGQRKMKELQAQLDQARTDNSRLQKEM